MSVTTKITGGALNISYSRTDTNNAYRRFDAFGIRPNRTTDSADVLIINRFLVEVIDAEVPFSITAIELFPTRPDKGMVGWASLVLNQSLVLNSVAFHTRLHGDRLRLVYPIREFGSDNRVTLFHPITREVGDYFEQAVTEKMMDLMRQA